MLRGAGWREGHAVRKVDPPQSLGARRKFTINSQSRAGFRRTIDRANASWRNGYQVSYILIADDNPDTRNILSRAFERAGLTCTAVADGTEALKAIQARPPALIITDLLMPKMNGFSLLGYLQADRNLADIPVVVLSSVAAPQMRKLPNVIAVFQKGDLDLTKLRDLALKRFKALGLKSTDQLSAAM